MDSSFTSSLVLQDSPVCSTSSPLETGLQVSSPTSITCFPWHWSYPDGCGTVHRSRAMATMVSSTVSPHLNSLVLDFQMSHSLPSFETRSPRFSGIIRFHKIMGICKVIHLCRIIRFCKIVHLPLKGARGSCFPENQTLLMLEGSSFGVGSDFHPGSEYDEAVAT